MRRLFAKGRLRPGEMNRTEKAYAARLDALKASGEISAWWFEDLKLRIAAGACWYCPDFLVMRSDGALELHEVKGSPRVFLDDAKVKAKAAATRYPFPLFVAYPDKQSPAGWRVQELI